jgi:hypothetical protein
MQELKFNAIRHHLSFEIVIFKMYCAKNICYLKKNRDFFGISFFYVKNQKFANKKASKIARTKQIP